jgi:hypothetical protein
MSIQAVAYVVHYSPFTGSVYVVHYALADIASPYSDYMLMFTDEALGADWRLSARTVRRARTEITEAGFLTDMGEHYRFEMPETKLANPGQSGQHQGENAQGTLIVSLTNVREPRPRARTREAETTKTGNRRLPATPFPTGNFIITERMREWLSANGLDRLDIRRETERFRDYAYENDRRCRDWVAAWRRWMSNAGQYDAERRRVNGQRGDPIPIQPLRGELEEFYGTEGAARIRAAESKK